jgi:hypothetical protein
MQRPPSKSDNRSIVNHPSEKGTDEANTSPGREASKSGWFYAVLVSNLIWTGALFLKLAGDAAINDMFVNSDQLYAAALVSDVLRSAQSITDWALTPAPYFFPDLALSLSLYLVGFDIESAAYAAGAIQLFAIAASGGALARRMGASGSHIAALTFIAPALLWVYPWTLMPNSLFRITRHGAAVWMSFLVLKWLMNRTLEHQHRLSLLCFIASTIFAFSDPLFVVSCVVPLLMISALSSSPRTNLPTPSMQRLGALAWGSAVGWISLAYFPAQPGVDVQTAVGKIGVTVGKIASWKKDYLADGVLCVVIATVAGLEFFRARNTEKSWYRFFSGWCLLSMGCSWAAVLASGRASPRYLIVPWAAGILLIGLAALKLLQRIDLRSEIVARVLAALAVGGATATLLFGWSSIAHGSYRSELRAAAACIENFARRQGSDLVITDYWHAKPLSVFSGGAIQTVQVVATSMQPMVWINSRQAFRRLDKSRWNVVVANGLSSKMLKRYGRPAEQEQCSGLDVRAFRGQALRRMSSDLIAQAKSKGLL